MNQMMLVRFEASLMGKLEELNKEFPELKAKFERSYVRDNYVTLAIAVEANATDEEKALIFQSTARVFGLTKDDYGQVFTSARRQYKVIGINASSRRMPLLAERQPDGAKFKMTIESYTSSPEKRIRK